MLPLNRVVCKQFADVLCVYTYVLDSKWLFHSANSISPTFVDGFPSFVLFEEELDEACRFIARAEKIIFILLGWDLKYFDVLLTLRDRFLVAEVNLQVAEGMKLASKEMLVKVGEMYDNMSIHHWDAMAEVALLEN